MLSIWALIAGLDTIRLGADYGAGACRTSPPTARLCANGTTEFFLLRTLSKHPLWQVRVETLDGLFRNASWHSVFDGAGVVARTHHLLAERMALAAALADIDGAAAGLVQAVAGVPTHQQFLAEHCPAAIPTEGR